MAENQGNETSKGAGGAEQPAAAIDLNSFARYSEKYVYVYGTFAAPNEVSHSLELGSICGLTKVIVRQMVPPERKQ